VYEAEYQKAIAEVKAADRITKHQGLSDKM
jgi:hypothetical protein